MRQNTVVKFAGLQVQQNSFTVPQGFFERLENCVVSNDNIVKKRRGNRLYFKFQAGQEINCIFTFQNYRFLLSQNTLYRDNVSAVLATVVAVSGSPIITIRRASHGLRHNDYISDFQVANMDNFVAAFPNRQSDFFGIRQVISTFTAAPATRTTNVVTVTLANHGMVTGNTINITASTLSPAIAIGTKTVTVLTANTFSFPDVGANSAGTVTFGTLDTFRIQAETNATASVTSTTNAANYKFYVVIPGPGFTISTAGVTDSRVVFANKNAYFTTDNGIYKIERWDLPYLKAGIPPGLDLQGSLGLSSAGLNTGPILPNKQVGYRILFGRKDANGNEVISAPSQFLYLRNALLTNKTCLFTMGPPNIVKITSTAHGITAADVAAGTGVYIYNAVTTGGTGIPDGTRFPLYNVVDANNFEINLTAAGFTLITNMTSTSYGLSKTAKLYFSIPSEITSSEYFFRIYRTTQSVDQNTLPSTDFKLVDELNLTQQQITNGFVTYTDEADDILVSSAASLYTNPSQQGELQANDRPPRAIDMTYFKSYVVFANIINYRILDFNVVAPTNITSGDTITIGTQIYKFLGNAANEPFGNEVVIAAAVRAANVITVTWTNHGLSTGDTILLSDSVTLAATPGFKVITVTGANTFTFADTGAAVAGTVTIEGSFDATARRIVKRTIGTASVTLAESIQATAQDLVKAINRNPNSTVYARYLSGPNDVPGRIFLTAKDINAATFSIIASTTTTGQAFNPILPTSGTTVTDTQESQPGVLAFSKFNEPEAVPITNTKPAGSLADPIYRAVALRDSVIPVKSDGVFRMNGDTVDNFSITALDTTVKCAAPDSVVLLNNSVYMLSNQGVVQVTDSSVRITSRPIEQEFSSILSNPNLITASSGIAYESERFYLLSTLVPNSTISTPNVTYCYNYLTDAFSTWNDDEVLFATGHVSSIDNKLYSVPGEDKSLVYKERKEETRVDYSGQDYCRPVIVAIVATMAVQITSNIVTVSTLYEHDLKVGDVITLSRSSGTAVAAMTGGAASLDGVRTVTAVPDANTFTFTASNVGIGNATGTIYFQSGISEVDVSASTLNGSQIVTVICAFNHGLNSGNPINVNSVTPALAAGFLSQNSVLGYRTVTVTSPTTFTFLATVAAIGGVTGNINISDKKQNLYYVTLQTTSSLIPQVGDGIITGNEMYQIASLKKYSATAYVLQFNNEYGQNSLALAFLHSAYRANIKTTPLSSSTSVGMLKYFGEFQLTFRNYTSCTQISLNFSSDSTNATGGQFWDFKVGTDNMPVNFTGWGDIEWGEAPWGGDISIISELFTRPAVILRTYVPQEVFMGTFLQAIMQHRVIGEALELQALSYFSQTVTQRTSR